MQSPVLRRIIALRFVVGAAKMQLALLRFRATQAKNVTHIQPLPLCKTRLCHGRLGGTKNGFATRQAAGRIAWRSWGKGA